MRMMLALVVLCGCFVVARSQPPISDGKAEAPPRFGIPHKGKALSQATPKETLASVIEVIDRGKIDYLVAHLLDPAFTDDRIADRARQIEPIVEAELARIRDAQLQAPGGVPEEQRVPVEPPTFRAAVARLAHSRATQQIVTDIRAKLTEDSEAVRDFRRFLREGTFADAEGTSKATLPDVKDRAVFFKKRGDRWFIENRQVEEKVPAVPMPAPAP
jgi:hypothetical protein